MKFTCDAYINFAKNAPWQESICSSLTELFAGDAHRERIETFPKNYPWIEEDGYQYFRSRVAKVEEDVKQYIK